MKDRRQVVLLSLAAVFFLWTVQSAVDAFIFHKSGFLSLLIFDVSLHTVYSRVLMLAGLAVYGIVITEIRDMTERSRTEEESRMHHEQMEKKILERTEELHAINELLQKEIQDRTRTEEELCRSETFLDTIFDSFHDPFCIVDREYRIVKFNGAYARTKDKQPQELLRKTCYEVLYKKSGTCEECVVQKTFLSANPCVKEKMVAAPGMTDAWIEICTYPIFDRDGRVSHVIQYSRDITERKRAEEEKRLLIVNLNRLSTTDSLTGLLNRRALSDALQSEIERAQRYGNDLSLILCDIDRFKKINDTHGHATGDGALQAVAASLKRWLRKTDILGRYGGDEFMIILPETAPAGARQIAEKIRSAAAEIALNASGKSLGISLSIGVASCCTAVDTMDSLVKLADAALYKSKHRGRNRVSSARA